MDKNKANIYLKNFLSIIGFVLMVFMIYLYNRHRIMNSYSIGFLNKEYSLNFIPFKNFIYTISLLYQNILLKIIFFIVLGIVLKIILHCLGFIKTKHYILNSVLIMLVMEVLVSFTSKFPVVIDINNIIFYSIGFTIGFFVFDLLLYALKKAIKLICKFANETGI